MPILFLVIKKRSGQKKTFLPLSNNIRRRPHLHTHREETPSNESEEEQTDEMICRPNSKGHHSLTYI
jgi:hypothetical protein